MVEGEPSGLEGRHRAKYQKLALGHSGSKVSGADFMRSLGRERDVSKAFRSWLKSEQYPLEIVHGEWEERANGTLFGGTSRPGEMATALLRDDEPGFACNVHGLQSPDVTKALIREKVVTKAPTSKSDMKAIQAAFNTWTEQSGLPQKDVSRILSYSVGPSA